MIALPPFDATPTMGTWCPRSCLPISDAAAVSLGEWFLADSPGRSIEKLAAILQDDPPLALWVAVKADRLSSAPPRTIADLAAMLAEHGLAWLQWDAAAADQVTTPVLREEIAARAAVAILLSEVAAELAAAHGEAAREQARFLGLLYDPAQWLSALAIRPPEWLAPQHFDPAAVHAVEEALRSAGVPPAASGVPSSGAGVPPASGCRTDCQSVVFSGTDCQSVLPSDLLARKLAVSPRHLQRGLDLASRWSAAHLAARWLSPLMARLARLAILERSFRQSVEAEKLTALAEFAAGAGHEINNPLAVIAGRAQLLLRDEADPERRRDLALMNTQAMRVNEMIADLRLFATPPDLERQSLDLTLLVRRVIDEMQPLAVAQDTILSLADASSAVPMEADPVQLTVALRSLCQNALEVLGHRGRIEVTLGIEGGEVRIEVADDGPGILPQQRPHIFEPFYSARQAGRGVGMGLSKCWRIVTQHGGRIEVGDRGGCGAVFTIRLPLG